MNKQDIQTALLRDLATHVGILENAYETSIVSVETFQEWVFNTFKGIGVETEKFRVDSEEVKAQPAFRQTFADQRLKGKGPPNVLGRLNPSVRDGILIFAHADKHPATYEFGKQHPRLLETREPVCRAGSRR